MTVDSRLEDGLLAFDCRHVHRILVGFIRDEVTKTGLRVGVIGLSGGVDSALSAALAAEALGPENVIGAILPYRTSDPASAEDARLVAKKLGIRTVEIDITPMVDPYFEKFDPGADRIRRGNVMARQRMIVLYDLSRKERALVIGAGNRTELLLGYTTLFGDSACAINPLGDLFKTQVWKLAEEIGLPEQIIKKTPSADLWQGQTDEGELGFDYRTADSILSLLVDQRLSAGRIAALGLPPEVIEKIAKRMQASQFKRMPPIIAKLSHRTINRDFRYPRDWGL